MKLLGRKKDVGVAPDENEAPADQDDVVAQKFDGTCQSILLSLVLSPRRLILTSHYDIPMAQKMVRNPS